MFAYVRPAMPVAGPATRAIVRSIGSPPPRPPRAIATSFAGDFEGDLGHAVVSRWSPTPRISRQQPLGLLLQCQNISPDLRERPHRFRLVEVPREADLVADLHAGRPVPGCGSRSVAHAVVVVTGEPPGDLGAREVAGQLHTAMASSRTRCSRITRGAPSASKWQSTASLAISFRSSQFCPCV